MLRRGDLALLITVLAACAAVYWPFFGSGLQLGSGEAERLHIPYAHVLLDHARASALPHWNNSVGLGEPFGANPQTMAYYPLRWVSLLSGEPAASVTLLHLMHQFIAAAGAFLLARRFGLRPTSSSVVALLYAATPFITHLAVRPNDFGAASWSPWIVLAAIALSRAHTARALALLAAAFALSALCASPALLLSQVILALVIAGRRGAVRAAEAMFSLAWAIGLTAIVALPFLEYVGHATVLGPEIERASLRSMVLLSDRSAAFLGVSLAVLAAAGMIGRGRRAWRLVLCALAFVAASFFWAELLIGAMLPLCLLAGFGVAVVVRVLGRRSRLLVAAGVAAAIVFAALAQMASPEHWLAYWTPTVVTLAALFGAARFGRVGVAVAVAVELACAHAVIGMPEWVAPSVLHEPQTLVSAANIAPGERVAINPAIKDTPIAGTTARQRLLPLRFVEDGLSGVALHDGLVPARFHDVMEVTDVVMLEMFAARYAIGYWDAPAKEDIIELTPWPRAWLVTNTESVDDDESRRTFFAQPRTAEHTAFGEGLPALATELPDDCAAHVQSLSHEELVVKATCSVPSVLVTSDLWYPGWRVDGVPVLRANYLMRAVSLEAGAREVRFEYEPGSFKLGALISLAALIGLIAALVRRARR